MSGSKLADDSIADKDLGMVEAVQTDGGDSSSDSDDDDDRGEFRGFCVYNNKICVYGNDGLFAATIKK